MTKTIHDVVYGIDSHRKAHDATVVIDSYTANGEAFTAGDFGLAEIEDLVILSAVTPGKHIVDRDLAAKKLKVYFPTGAHSHTENTAGSYTQNATTSDSTKDVMDEASAGALKTDITSTADVVNGNQIVTMDGDETSNLAKGDFIKFATDTENYKILAISATKLTLDRPYQGTTANNVAIDKLTCVVRVRALGY